MTIRLQARNPEVKCSKKRGSYPKYSAEERTTFQETKIVLCSISWQVFHRDAYRISIINVAAVLLAIQFVFDAGVLYFYISKCPLKQLEVIAIVLSPIATGKKKLFLCLPLLPYIKLINMWAIFSIAKYRKDSIFVRHMRYENKICCKILLTKYLSYENFRLYGISFG